MDTEGTQDYSQAKRLWRVVRAVYYMLQKGITKRRAGIDFHLLFKRGKVAGKAIGNLMFHHHRGNHRPASSSSHNRPDSGGRNHSLYNTLSCRAVESNVSYYNPRDVEFSCSSTPAYPMSFRAKRMSRRENDHRAVASAVQRAFDILSSETPDSPLCSENRAAPLASPSPFWDYDQSSVPVRQLRISDSPFLALEDDQDDEARRRINQEAEEFITRFYEKIRSQQVGEQESYEMYCA